MNRTNTAMARPQQQEIGFSQRNPYAMDVDERENRSCYTCGGFEYLAKNCRNKEIGMNRRMEVDQNTNSNLNGEGGLGSPN